MATPATEEDIDDEDSNDDDAEEARWFTNHYYCNDCDQEWEDEWDCQCDDRCPGCNVAYTPYQSDEH